MAADMSLASTTDYPLPETTTMPSSGELYAEFISAPASSMSPAAIAEHMQQNQITFEIPTAHDLRHIDALHSFNTLLQRIGNAAGSYDSAPPASISTEQLSNSVVLDLADLREHNADADANSTWEQIFGDADMHAIVNYLWIGVVTSLVVLSLVFIMFSCYFYRKFRTWKKCNKDIRAQLHAASDSYSSHGASHHLISYDASRLLQQVPGNGSGSASGNGSSPGGANEAGFYQIESPPCYTIATGLPSYDEALHHQPRHFAYGMKFVYPSLAAVHHHHHHHSHSHNNQRACISGWAKDAVQQSPKKKLQKCKLSATVDQAQTQTQMQLQLQAQTEDKASPTICINMPDEQELRNELELDVEHRNATSTATSTLLPAAAADDDCASLVVVVAA
ncbi:PREDICTED: protein commissureless isoform X1 [Drosophila arizonae]|uniref:Protein commissureless isoform X1 n=1 Tax=Drosophila arizonae TaxID=7263 RepID=A0ABM1PAT9_DROAR|nr:PREDICTED: protein commissureless isoform X1 [Drosophila arizonae]